MVNKLSYMLLSFYLDCNSSLTNSSEGERSHLDGSKINSSLFILHDTALLAEEIVCFT